MLRQPPGRPTTEGGGYGTAPGPGDHPRGPILEQAPRVGEHPDGRVPTGPPGAGLALHRGRFVRLASLLAACSVGARRH